MIVLLSLAAAVSPAVVQNPDAPIAITNVTVIDVARGARVAGQTVVIRGARIAAMGSASSLPAPSGARIIDGRGKFLIPGLWDFHVHATGGIFETLFQPVMVANGVTAMRDMWGEISTARAAREKIARGETVGPRSVVAGNLVDGTPPIWPGSTGVATPEAGRRFVDSIAAAGGGFIKVYSRLDPDVYRAIAQRAKERGIPFAGHIPTLLAAREASDLGQRTVEHLTNLLTDCSSERDALRAEVAGAVASPRRWDSAGILQRGQALRVLASYDPGRCREVARRFKANGTVMVPTMTVLRSVAFLDDSSLRRDPRLKYVPAWLSSRWDPSQDFRFRMLTADDWAFRKRAHQRQLEIIRLFREEGVTFLPGTDLGNPYLYPGFSLHDELANFVAIGYSASDALRAATLGPAEFFRAADSLGTVARGKLADVVLLDADPLADIRNTTRIAAVVANGRLYDRAALDALLAEGEKRAKSPPPGGP
jgi:imidazolonepropionase-like amidohydrolase